MQLPFVPKRVGFVAEPGGTGSDKLLWREGGLGSDMKCEEYPSWDLAVPARLTAGAGAAPRAHGCVCRLALPLGKIPSCVNLKSWGLGFFPLLKVMLL